MNPIIQLGPLSLNGTIVAFIVSYIFVSGFLNFYSKTNDLNIVWLRSLFDSSLLAGVIGARLSFAAVYWQSYLEQPWTLAYFWQPGYSLWGGMVSVVGFACIRFYLYYRKKSTPLRPLISVFSISFFVLSITTSSLIWLMQTRSEIPSTNTQVFSQNFQFLNQHGELISTETLLGKPVILNFWATWCAPCRREMPLLEKTFLENSPTGIEIIAINLSDPQIEVLKYLNDNNLTLPVWTDGVQATTLLFDQLGGEVMPSTYFVFADGTLSHMRVGELSAATLQQGIKKLTR